MSRKSIITPLSGKDDRLAEGFPGQRLYVLPTLAERRSQSLPVCRDLHVTHIGSYDRAPRHFVDRPAGAEGYVLIVCRGGRGQVKLGADSYSLVGGDAILLPPGQGHVYWADDKDPWSILWVHFAGLRAADYAGILAGADGEPQFSIGDLPAVQEAFERCCVYTDGGYTDADLLGLSTSLACLLGLCRVLQRSSQLRVRQSEERVFRTIDYMRANLSQPLTLESLARVAGWAPNHYSAVFRRQLKVPPVEYLLRLRIQRGCELLRLDDSPVSQIAGKLGYDDPFYFSRLFRARTGRSPTEYRREFAPGRS